MTFKERLHENALIVECELEKYFASGQLSHEKGIRDVMRYSLLSGGKRIRPSLLLESGKLFDLKFDQLINLACAIEMIHTYSLIHDDLPAMDDDALRRGKATAHVVYGEAMAILAGDALLNFAFELMTQTALIQNDMNYVKAMRIVGRASGLDGMIGGQVADILSEEEGGSKETLEYIHENKTGQLLTAPLLVAGAIAGVNEEMMIKLRKFGQSIGLMFQIKDDLLDIESNEATLGKPIGSDEKNGKLTYPSLYGIEASRLKIHELQNTANDLIAAFPGDPSFMYELVAFLGNRIS